MSELRQKFVEELECFFYDNSKKINQHGAKVIAQEEFKQVIDELTYNLEHVALNYANDLRKKVIREEGKLVSDLKEENYKLQGKVKEFQKKYTKAIEDLERVIIEKEAIEKEINSMGINLKHVYQLEDEIKFLRNLTMALANNNI